ncbi:hypothetical protein R0J90_21865, partial [Micrococcus sp. SIMBA_144]
VGGGGTRRGQLTDGVGGVALEGGRRHGDSVGWARPDGSTPRPARRAANTEVPPVTEPMPSNVTHRARRFEGGGMRAARAS